jgi:hypothetical protein
LFGTILPEFKEYSKVLQADYLIENNQNLNASTVYLKNIGEPKQLMFLSSLVLKGNKTSRRSESKLTKAICCQNQGLGPKPK